MINMAHLYIDDFENELTLQYANALFGFQNIHNEAQLIQGKSMYGGKISLKRFSMNLFYRVKRFKTCLSMALYTITILKLFFS